MKNNYIPSSDQPLGDHELTFLRQCLSRAFIKGFAYRYFKEHGGYLVHGGFVKDAEVRIKQILKHEVPPARLIFTYLTSFLHGDGFLIEILFANNSTT
jgi:hypothetical protein